MKLLKYILSIIFAAIGILCIIGSIYNQFTRPELTQTQLLFQNWHLYLSGIVLIYLAVVPLDLFKKWSDL